MELTRSREKNKIKPELTRSREKQNIRTKSDQGEIFSCTV
jgi:hypothetical protein